MLGDRAKTGPTATKRSLWFHGNSRWLGDEPAGGPPPPPPRPSSQEPGGLAPERRVLDPVFWENNSLGLFGTAEQIH